MRCIRTNARREVLFGRVCASVTLLMFLLMPTPGVAIAASGGRSGDGGRSKDAADAPPTGTHLKKDGLRNFGQVTPTLFRGGQPTAEGFATLASMGITIVVDATRSTRDKATVEKLGMTYIPLGWYCSLPKDKVLDQFMEIIRENPRKKIFVHCRLGEDRTGMMIAAYRMAQDGWSAKQAMQEMHKFGYGMLHHFTCPGLARYEKSFPYRLQNDPAFDNLRLTSER